VRGSNRHKNNGKDSSAVWQKVERNDKMISKAGHLSNSSIHDKGAHEVGKKGVQEDPTRIQAKCNQNRKMSTRSRHPFYASKEALLRNKVLSHRKTTMH